MCFGPNVWSSDPPECKVVQCDYPSLAHGNLVSGFGKKKSDYKAEVEFECNQGYDLEGSRKIVCAANSTWVPRMPSCVKGVEPIPPSKPSSPGRPTPDETPSKTLGAGVTVVIILAVVAVFGLMGCFVYPH